MGKTRGKFIVLEGLDGSGKTSQLEALRERFLEQSLPCEAAREPSDGLIGRITRDAIRGQQRLAPETLALLFAADRYEHIVNELLPLLEQGVHVLCDRFVFSNIAYQGLSIPMEDIIQNNKYAMELLMPDLTVFLDTDPMECVRRMGAARSGSELYDHEGQHLRANYRKAFALLADQARVEVVDGNGSAEQILGRLWSVVSPLVIEE